MELLRTAEPYGVNILVENFNRMHKEGVYWIDNAAALRALIDFVDHPLFHAVCDAGHGNMQDMPQDESLRILGHHVYALHIQDNYGDSDIHLAPFFGTLNLDSLMHGLKDIGYKGYFTFESGNILLPSGKRRPYPQDERLLRAPLDLRIKAEALRAKGQLLSEPFEVRRKRFIAECKELIAQGFAKAEVADFFAYYSQKEQGGERMLFETYKGWDTQTRFLLNKRKTS